MPLFYLETSALVKLYILESGTDALLRIANDPALNRMTVFVLAPVEVHSAVRRRERAGDLDPKVAALLLDQMSGHLRSRFIVQPLIASVLDKSLELIDRYALRAYDAIQLAGCLVLRSSLGSEPVTFVCSDLQLLDAARQEQLPILDPSASP